MNMGLEKYLINEINNMVSEEIKIMEVCGTHTQIIARLGLRSILSSKVKLLSGPGCPVCVTEVSNIDRKFVFLGVGFETTAPSIALTIKTAAERGIKNLFFLTTIKLMPPILHYIFKQSNNEIRGLICPGHVATVKGSNYFQFIKTDYGIPAAVCGFEPRDIIIGIHYLVKNIVQNEKQVYENLYKRCVREEGNPIANGIIEEVFQTSSGEWRGIGKVEKSALTINEKYAAFNGMNVFAVDVVLRKNQISCECKDILLGKKRPRECKLFGIVCNPVNPHGPCMLSSEGSCAIAYRYREEI